MYKDVAFAHLSCLDYSFELKRLLDVSDGVVMPLAIITRSPRLVL